MYKLSGHSLTRGEMIIPETQPMTVQERESSCTITMDPEINPEIGFGDWILDDDWPEGNYVWRVRSVQDSPFDGMVQVELEHIIKTLDDRQISSEITTAMISGGSSCTAQATAQYLLGLQSDWVLGDFAFSVTNPYEFNGGSILDALETVTGTLDNAQWEYDLSSYPFTLHFRQRAVAASCEMRCGRNLSTLRRTVSRAGMYTRIYPIGKNNLRLDAGYLSKNETLYGRIDRVETDQSKSTKENLQAWAQGLLNRHSEPEMNVSISGLEMSEETGEALDRLRINTVCRVPVPKKNITILERIVRLQWRDRRKEPENVSVTLANNSADITSIVKNASRASGRAAQGQAKQNYLFQANGDNLLYEVFDDSGHVHGILRMTSESLRVAFDNTIESARSEFRMTAESLRIQFEEDIGSTRSEFLMTSESLRIQFENDLDSARSEFSMTAESLRISFESGLTSARGDFSMTAESLRIAFENETTSLRSAIQSEAGRISLVVEGSGSGATVKRASIVAAINEDSSSTVTIKADKVDLGAYVLASTLDTNWIKTQIENAGLISVGTLQIANGTTPTGSANMVNILSLTRKYRVVSDGSNGYKLQYTNLLNGATWVDCESGDQSVNFSRATTLTGAWGSGNDANLYTVTASPQGNTESDRVYLQIEGAANPNATVYAKIYHTSPNEPTNNILTTEMTLGENVGGKYVELYTGSGNSKIQKGKVSTADTFDAGDAAGQLTGWSEAYGKMSWPGQNTSSASMTVKGPAATKATNPNQVSREYVLSSDNNVAYIKQGAVVVAQLTHNKYSSGDAAGQLTGWSEAYAKVSWPGSNTSTASMTVKAPAATKATNPNQVSRDYTVSVDSSYAYIKQGSTTVARVSHTQYSSGDAAGQLTGWSEAYGKVSWPGSNTSTASMTVKAPAATKATNPNQVSRDYTVSVDSSYAYIKQGATTVARVSHSYKYTQTQYDAALATVPSGYFNSATVTFTATDIGSSAESNDNAITATAKNGSTTLGSASQVIHMGTGSWSSGKIGVTARLNDSNGACVNRVYVNAPGVTLGANTTTKPSGSALKTVTVGSGGNHTYFTVTVGGSYKGYVDVKY